MILAVMPRCTSERSRSPASCEATFTATDGTARTLRLFYEGTGVSAAVPELTYASMDGVVSVKDGMCTGCYIMIPRGDLNRIAAGKADPVCPNCGTYISQ